MKRCWFGLALLVTLLAGGLLTSRSMVKIHGDISRTLETAADAAVREDWNAVRDSFAGAREEWERWWHFSAAFADHEPMEEIDSLFAQGEVCLRLGEGAELGLVCAQLARQIRAMGDAHACTWWNLL